MLKQFLKLGEQFLSFGVCLGWQYVYDLQNKLCSNIEQFRRSSVQQNQRVSEFEYYLKYLVYACRPCKSDIEC